jgi:hypothetical protein
MRKRKVDFPLASAHGDSEESWLDLQQIATIEVTSENPDFPIESAFSSEQSVGWRASQPGEQLIRIVFDHPISLHRIQLHFRELEVERTQEFALRWLSTNGGVAKEIVRQQWNFSPAGSTSEIEDYQVNLENVSALELVIKPDLTRREAPATLALWRLA